MVEFDAEGKVLSIEEEAPGPQIALRAVPGIIFYDAGVGSRSRKGLRPSARGGAWEITDVNLEYLRRGELRVELLGRGFAWLDTGDGRLADGGLELHPDDPGAARPQVSCVEEIAWREGFIDSVRLKELAKGLEKNGYGRYLRQVWEEDGNDT